MHHLKKTITDIEVLQEFIDQISIDYLNENEISVRMFHFNFSHFPVDFDNNCNYFSYNKKLFDSSQNYQALKMKLNAHLD